MIREANSRAIKPINKAVIHRICSGQVILDLASAVKELVENSLDAGSTCIEINLKDHGEEHFKVIDNGCGISSNNFQSLALKHHTSKISDFSDLNSLTTFGFRGEALSSLCALGNLSIETRTKDEPIGTHLSFDHSGAVIAERKTARQVGTTVTVEKLFSPLPVRSKEFSRNIKREYGKLISLLNAYGLIAKGVRILCTNTTNKGSKSLVLKTQGSDSLKDNIINIFNISTFNGLVPLNLTVSEGCTVEGYLSKSGNGNGRNSTDRQFFYVNNRPVDMPKVAKLINEMYKGLNSKQYPIVILNFSIPTQNYDVNVTPDKRKFYFSNEGLLMSSLRETLEKVYSSNDCVYLVNSVENPKNRIDIKEENDEDDSEEEIITPSKTLASKSNVMKRELEGISAYRFVNTQKDSGLSEKINNNSKSLNLNASRSSGFVQSSISNFVSVSKRKVESGITCNPLTEVPVLRKTSCLEIRARDFSTKPKEYGAAEKTNYRAGFGTSFSGASVRKRFRSDIYENSRIGTRASVGTEEDEEMEAEPESDPELGTNENDSTNPELICEEENSKPKTIVINYPPTFFSMNELVKRRQHNFSLLSSNNKSSLNRRTHERNYAAATMEKSQPVDEEEKARALAAAVVELERFFKKEDFAKMQVIGQFNLGFIVGKIDQDLFIVDQHAADEKYNFERLSQSTTFNLQPLLQPIRMELSPEEEVVASMHLDIIRKNGFVVAQDTSASPGHQFILKAVPFSRSITFGLQDLKDLIGSLVDGKEEFSIISSFKLDTSDSICPWRVRAMLASRACHSSCVVGDALTKIQMQRILNNLATLRSPWNCPHGRPTMRHLVDLTTIRKEETAIPPLNLGTI